MLKNTNTYTPENKMKRNDTQANETKPKNHDKIFSVYSFLLRVVFCKRNQYMPFSGIKLKSSIPSTLKLFDRVPKTQALFHKIKKEKKRTIGANFSMVDSNVCNSLSLNS